MTDIPNHRVAIYDGAWGAMPLRVIRETDRSLICWSVMDGEFRRGKSNFIGYTDLSHEEAFEQCKRYRLERLAAEKQVISDYFGKVKAMLRKDQAHD